MNAARSARKALRDADPVGRIDSRLDERAEHDLRRVLASPAVQPVPRLVADEAVPVLSETGRIRQPRERVLVPLLAAAGVVAVVLVAGQLRPAAGPVPLAIQPSPTLGAVVPPDVVRRRLGALPGHVNGPPVATADLLAISPTAPNGVTLRTVAAVRPRAKPDRNGVAQLDRCLVTYSDPGRSVLEGNCDWGVPADSGPDGVTTDVVGPPGRSYFVGTAPPGTAAVLLSSPGREPAQVPTAGAGRQWADRSHYVAWWPRTATDVIALDRTGRELARTRLPSDVPVRASEQDPELGTVETPVEVREYQEVQRRSASSRPGRRYVVPDVERVDVLARQRIGSVEVWTVGAVSDASRCTWRFTRQLSGARSTGGLSGGCGPRQRGPGVELSLGRSYSGTGRPGERLVTGEAPAGTVRVRVSGAGLPSREVRAYSAGPRWGGTAFFTTPWPASTAVSVIAYDTAGRVLARDEADGLDLHAYTDRQIDAVVDCLRAKGLKVTRQGTGYNYQPKDLPAGKADQLDRSCKALARTIQ